MEKFRIVKTAFFFSLLYLLFSVGNPRTVFPQEISLPLPLNHEQKLIASVVMEPALNELFNKYRPGVLGLGFAMNPMFKTGFQREYGFTEDQSALIMQLFQERFVEAPESFQNFGMVMKSLTERIDENTEELILSDEEKEAIQMGYTVIFDTMQEISHEVFTPEQLQKVSELEFAVFGGIDSPFLQAESLEILDLSEEQRAQLMEFQTDIADEKLAVLDDLTQFTQKFMKTGKMSIPEIRAFEEKTNALKKKIGDRTREILNDQQLEKAEKLIARQERLLKRLINFGGISGLSSWIPGLDSWKPGDPIPEQLQAPEKKRSRGFPRRATTEKQPTEKDSEGAKEKSPTEKNEEIE